MNLLQQQPGELQARLDKYLQLDSLYRKVYYYTKQRFESAENLTAHNWEHALRDTLNAVVIGEAEGADMSIVLPAITMHDIGFLYGANGRTHGHVGADNVNEYLRSGNIFYPTETVDKIADCIRTHKGSMHDEKPETIEAKVVADADLLEKFGPMGMYQLIRTFTEFNQPLEKVLSCENTIMNLTLETASGKKQAEPGRQFVLKFLQDLREANTAYTMPSDMFSTKSVPL